MGKSKSKFKFIDLFAGIGGFHVALHQLGGECVFASEMDKHARVTYEHNFKKISPKLFKNNNKLFNADIRNMSAHEIPDFDVLCAGFPCQPFSQAGYKRGFDDAHSSERGNLFFNVAEILEAKKPKAFFLENVRGLVSHDNGNTFKVIRNILEKELGYSFYFKIVKASDYGLPQLRPRAFMVGFRDDVDTKDFQFPEPIPLKYNMSHVWGGECSREIGFTMRVGGRGSTINDRRNWDAYLVDGVVKTLMPEQGVMLQGFPNEFEFPVSNRQAMKQLGNSVAVDAVREVARALLQYKNNLSKNTTTMKKTNNKGEWTELLVFVKLLLEQKLSLADEDMNATDNFFKINKVTTQNLDLEFFIVDSSTIEIGVKGSDEGKKKINIADIINEEILLELTTAIKDGSGTFEIPAFEVIQSSLGFNVVKGGTSYQKADIQLDISNDEIEKENEGFGIKSYLGSKPTLLNASGNTNFVFEITNFNSSLMDEVNSINTRTKLKDRIAFITEYGGTFNFIGAEQEAMNYNLKMVDSQMPNLIGHVLMTFFFDRVNSISDIVKNIDEKGILKKEIGYEDVDSIKHMTKKLLVDILLGFFAGKKWDGKFDSNGTIVMKSMGDCVGFHIIEMENLKNYLYQHIKLDTPSTTRHRYGKVYKEKDGKLYFKLNLQLRF